MSASGLLRTPRLWLRVLLWLAGAMIPAMLALLISMEYSIEKYGGGEMVDTIAVLLGILLLVHYAVVFLLGRTMLNRGGARWGWLFVAVMLLLVFVPPIMLWKLMS